MSLHIETGHYVTADVKKIDCDAVRFVTEDGRTMFEVIADKDGKSIEVRAIEVTKINGQIYAARINIKPRSSNSVQITVPLYAD